MNRHRSTEAVKRNKIKRGKYYYAIDHAYQNINNTIPDKFVNKIICGDSKVILKELPDNSIDLIFTSPPYNFGIEYDNSEDVFDWQTYFDGLFEIFTECIRVLKYGGRIAINIQPVFSDYIPAHHIISNFFIENSLIWKGEILWEKNNYNCKYTSWGSWRSPSNPYLKYTWEFIEVFCKGDLKKEGDASKSKMSADEFKEWTEARWTIAPEHGMKKFGHPAMFPEKLAYRIVNLFSYKEDIVLDPFNGIGTTCLAAKKSERKYLGIDISDVYCQAAEDRINQFLF